MPLQIPVSSSPVLTFTACLYVWGHMPSHVPVFPPFPPPYSESASASDQQGTGPKSGLISSSTPWLQCAWLPAQTVCGPLARGSCGNRYPRQIKWPMCLSGRCGGIVTRLLEKLEGVGYFTRSLSLFVCRIPAPAACLNLQQSTIGDTNSCPSVLSTTAIFNISLVGVAELLHISLGKRTYGWIRFRWCHWVKKSRVADHEVHSTSQSDARSAWEAEEEDLAATRGPSCVWRRVHWDCQWGFRTFEMMRYRQPHWNFTPGVWWDSDHDLDPFLSMFEMFTVLLLDLDPA